MKLDIKKELDQNSTILLLMPSTQYNDVVVENMKELSGKKICYVTLNKTYASLVDIFKNSKINTKNVFFIDAISKTIQDDPPKNKNCAYISSPGAITELSIAINKKLGEKFDYLIFDSLTNLLIYQKKAPIAKFISTLTTKIRSVNTKGIMYSLSVKEQSELIQEAGMFVDKVITKT